MHFGTMVFRLFINGLIYLQLGQENFFYKKLADRKNTCTIYFTLMHRHPESGNGSKNSSKKESFEAMKALTFYRSLKSEVLGFIYKF